MPSKNDPTTQGEANQLSPQTWQGAENSPLLDVLRQIASTLQNQNKLLELIQSTLQAPRTQSPTASDFPPGSDARKAADAFNGILARLNYSAPPDASGQ